MPELAEVDYYRRQWAPGIGLVVEKVHTNPAARIYRDCPALSIRKALPGTKLLSSHCHGKQWLFRFSGGFCLSGHLGMTGKLFSEPRSTYVIEKHDHLILDFPEINLVFQDPRMFGKVQLDLAASGHDFPKWWLELPPEILSSDFTKEFVLGFCQRFRKTPVKTLLLDQRGFPGIGNWMADEVCWRMEVNPATRSGELTDVQLARLWKETRHVCRAALRVIAEDWGDPPTSWLFPHRWKDGGKCPRPSCRGNSLERADLRGRTTCWCPRCQK